MVISKLPAFRPPKCHLKLVVALGLCAMFQTVGADAYRLHDSSSMSPEVKATERNLRQKYIKRLMPADPESTEAMLADRGLDCLDPSTALS